MPSEVTLQDVANRAGVHRSTVSLALRDHPRISEPVRQRVQKIARDLGYRANPLVSALMQSRRTGRAEKDTVIGYVTCYPTRYGWRPPHHDRPDYFPGAEARAKELGYKLEHFWLGEPGMTAERFCAILMHRGIDGLLIGRLPPGQSELGLTWQRFSCVALGRTLSAPLLHRVAEDHFAGAREAMERLLARGSRRIGFVFSETDESPQLADQWLGAYLRQQMRVPVADRLEPFFFDPRDDHARDFARWFGRRKPDALLVTNAVPVMQWLRHLDQPAPKALPVIALVKRQPEAGRERIYCDPAKLGGLAVEMLVGLMHRGEVGVPQEPHQVLLQGEWHGA
jgi:LacI family transcriptional regulator